MFHKSFLSDVDFFSLKDIDIDIHFFDCTRTYVLTFPCLTCEIKYFVIHTDSSANFSSYSFLLYCVGIYALHAQERCNFEWGLSPASKYTGGIPSVYDSYMRHGSAYLVFVLDHTVVYSTGNKKGKGSDTRDTINFPFCLESAFRARSEMSRFSLTITSMQRIRVN